MIHSKECPFCDINDGKLGENSLPSSRAALGLYGGIRLLEGMVLRETDELVVVPDALPVGEGRHVLIIPKTHDFSYPSMHNGHGERVGEELAGLLKTMKTDFFPEGYVYFEHGSYNPGSNVQSIYHTHGHMVGTQHDTLPSIENKIRASGLNFFRISTDENYLKKVNSLANGYSFLFIRQGTEAILVVEDENNARLPSQFSQRNLHLLTRQDSNPFWDWKSMLNGSRNCEETMRIAVTRTAHLIEQWNNL